MENKEDDIENLFQERFANDEAPVSPRVWQNIKSTLPEEKKPNNFSFSVNSLLWIITGILMVSAVIGSFIIFNTTNFTAKPLHRKDLSTAESMTQQPVSDAHENNHFIETKSNDSSSDSFPTYHSNGHSIQQSNTNDVNPSNLNITHHSPITKEQSETTNNNSSYRKNSPNSSVNNNKVIASLKNKKGASKINSALSTEKLRDKKTNLSNANANSKDISYEWNEKSITGNATIEKSKANQDVAVTNQNNKKLNSSVNELTSTKSFSNDKLRSKDTTNNNIQVNADDTVNQKSQTANQILANTNAATIKSDTLHQVKNRDLDIDKSLVTKQNNDSISYVDDKQTILFNQPVQNNLDSTLTNNPSDLLTKRSSLIQNDSLKNTNSSETTTNNNLLLKSPALQNDSLSTSIATIISASDSLVTTMDSLQILTKDSVLTETIAKKEKGKSNLMKHLSFDLVASALLTGASTKATDTLYQAAVADKNKKDKNSLGYAAGIIVNYKLSNRLQASTGIVYTSFSEQYNFTYNLKTTAWVLVDSSLQAVEVDSINRDMKLKDQYSFISVPLQLSYLFLAKEKMHLSATVGIRSNILLKGVTYLPNANKSDVMEVKSGFNSISFSYLIALEAEYKLNDHAALLLQPTFIYGASSIHSKASSLSQKPYGVGLTIGLRFMF